MINVLDVLKKIFFKQQHLIKLGQKVITQLVKVYVLKQRSHYQLF